MYELPPDVLPVAQGALAAVCLVCLVCLFAHESWLSLVSSALLEHACLRVRTARGFYIPLEALSGRVCWSNSMS